MLVGLPQHRVLDLKRHVLKVHCRELTMTADPAKIFISLRIGSSHFNCCALLAAVAAAAEARELCFD